MKEFIEKLIGRLEAQPTEQFVGTYGNHELVSAVIDCCVECVNQLAEEYNNESVNGDLISRRVAKTKMAEWLRNWLGEKDKRSMEQALDELPTACNDGWIPCSEQLYPTATGYYLVTIKGFNRPMYAWWIWTERKWQYLNSQREIEDVIAWRELPAPYQPKGE